MKKPAKPAKRKTVTKAKSTKAKKILMEEPDFGSVGGQHSPSVTTDCPPVPQHVLKVAAEGDRRATLSEKLKAKETSVAHLIVEARAGTGKTTTLVEGLKIIKGIGTQLTPSPQQAKVWESMELSHNATSICFVAFNKSIATELQQRVPAGCDAMTMHSMGFKAVQQTFGRVKVNQYRVEDIISELTGRDIRELRKYQMEILNATKELVGLCKQNLIGFEGSTLSRLPDNSANNGYNWANELDKLAAHYDVELNSSRQEVFDLVPRVLERCKDVKKDNAVDFDDMIWLPVVLGLAVTRYDLLLVDEAQDLNKCQQQLALKAGKRLILCGDPCQAIYGFAGADAESMPRMFNYLSATDNGCEQLPLTVTRRCGKAIVEEARKIVPLFEAHETNSEGKISRAAFLESVTDNGSNYRTLVQDGDMIICRVNAPLVSQCFKFLKAGRKANIQGRNIGEGLIKTVKKLNAADVADLVFKLSDWLHGETKKEIAKRNPDENRLIALQDRYDCLVCFTDGVDSVAGVITKIESIFTDDKSTKGIRLSSIHKAKGLEASRVFFLMPEGAGCPHPMAKSTWQRGQEMNLKYVGITRAIEELIYVA
jgi:DNA helicase-2/ATP-dependent DNA helicase PcrA